MEKIGNQEIWSYFDSEPEVRKATNPTIRRGCGHEVSSYAELAQKVAELQFLNREHVLLFRGQATDYRSSRSSSLLKPSCFRLNAGKEPTPNILQARFEILNNAERELSSLFSGRKYLGADQIKRHRSIRWAILQHYEVCATPLLDVSQSLRIGASFASVDAKNSKVYLFVFGVPNLSGAITSSSEAGLQIIRLPSACPPVAVRPHFQEGYLLGEYPEIADYDQHSQYSYHEMDFGRRLLAKFCFDPERLWNNPNFPHASRKALYATQQRDELREIATDIRSSLGANEG
jgi:hypothetical protein